MALELSPEEGSWEVTGMAVKPGVLCKMDVPHGCGGGTGLVIRKRLPACLPACGQRATVEICVWCVLLDMPGSPRLTADVLHQGE